MKFNLLFYRYFLLDRVRLEARDSIVIIFFSIYDFILALGLFIIIKT